MLRSGEGPHQACKLSHCRTRTHGAGLCHGSRWFPPDHIRVYQQATNTLRRTLESLSGNGLQRRARDVTPPTLQEYTAAYHARKAAEALEAAEVEEVEETL